MAESGQIDVSKLLQGADAFVSSSEKIVQATDKMIESITNLQNSASKKSTLTFKANYKDLDKANEIIEEIQRKAKTPATIKINPEDGTQKVINNDHISRVGQVSNYYRSYETTENIMKEKWNSIVDYVNSNQIDISTMVDSRKSISTDVLRWANAFQALGGDISSVSEDLANFINQMRELPQLSELSGNSFTLRNFQEVFKYLNRLRDEAGAEFEGFNLRDSDQIDIKKIKQVHTERHDNEDDTSDEMTKDAEEANAAADRMGEAAKKYEKATREIMEARLKSQYKKTEISEDDVWGCDAYNDHSIQQLKDKLEELRTLRDSSLSIATDYNNRLANGETKTWGGRDLEEALQHQIDDYHNYSDQIEYIQNQLTDATLNFKPGESWGAEEIQALISLLQELQRQISTISEQFSAIGNNDFFSSINDSITNISSAFTTDKIEQFNSQLETMIANLQTLSSKKFETKIEIPTNQSDTDDAAKQEEIFLRKEFQRYKNVYDRIMQASDKQARKHSNSTGQEYLFANLLENRKVLEQFGNQERLQSRFSISSIEDSEKPLMQRIQTLMEFFKYIREARSGFSGDTSLWKSLSRISLPSSDSTRINNTLWDIYSKKGDLEIDDKGDLLPGFDLNTSFANSEEFKSLLQVIKEIRKVLGDDITSDSFNSISSSISELINKFSELNKLVTEFKETLTNSSLSIEGLDGISSLLKNGFGLNKNNGELPYLEQLINKLNEFINLAKLASQAIKSEGDASVAAAPKKDKATKANNDLAESAQRTAEEVPNATKAINSETTASEDMQSTIENNKIPRDSVKDPRRRGVYVSQTNLSNEDNYSYVERMGFAGRRSVNYRVVQDKDGNEEVRSSESTFVSFEKLENEILKIDGSIMQTTENIRRNLQDGLPVDGMISDLERLSNAQKELFEEAQYYFEDNGYMPEDNHVQDFYRRVNDNRNRIYNQIRQRQIEVDATRSDDDALRDATRLAAEDRDRQTEEDKQRRQARKEGYAQTKQLQSEQNKRDAEWSRMETEREKELQRQREMAAESEKRARLRNDLIEREQAQAINKEQERRWKESQLKAAQEPAFQAQQNVRLAQLERLRSNVEKNGLEFDMSKFDSLFDKLASLEVGDQNGLKEYQALLQQIQIDAENAAESIGKIFENSRKIDHEQWQGEFKDSINAMSSTSSDRWWNKHGFHDSKGNWTGALAEEAMEVDTNFEALKAKHEEYLQALRELDSISKEYDQSPSNFTDALIKARQDAMRIFGELRSLENSIDTSKFQPEQLEKIDEVKGNIDLYKNKQSAKLSLQGYKQDVAILKEYADAQDRLNNLRAKSVSHSLTNDEQNEIQRLKALLSSVDNATEAYERLKNARDNGAISPILFEKDNIDDLYKNAKRGSFASRNKISTNITGLFSPIKNKLTKSKASDADNNGFRPVGWASEMQRLLDQVDELETKAKNIDFVDPKAESTFDDIRKNLQMINEEYTNLSKSDKWKPVDDTWSDSFTNKIAKWMNENKKAAKAFRSELDELREGAKLVGNEFEASDYENRLSRIQTQAADKDLLGKSLGDRFKDQFKNTMTSLSTYYLSFQDFVRYGREAIQIVTELDTAMTELKKVSDESSETYSQFMQESFDMADRVGTTAEAMITSTADWKRLGKSFEDAKKFAEQSTVLMNVSEFQNVNDASDALISATQAYDDVASEDIIDRLNYVGNNFAVGTSDLAQGLQNAAAVLKTQGNDIDEALALLTAGNLVGQDMSKASAGIRTISLRISGTEEAKNELADYSHSPNIR